MRMLKYCIFWIILFLTFDNGFSQAHKNEDYAIIFTTFKYDYPHIWPNLNSIPEETVEIERLLRDEYGFKVIIVPNASRKDIERTLDEYNKSHLYGSDSQLLLFFSMHGQRSLQGAGYLIPKEGSDKPGTWLAISQLRDMVDDMPCPHILISLDACYAGTFGETRSIPIRSDWEIDNLDCNEKRKMFFENKAPTRKYLTAGRAEQRVPGRSLFSRRWQMALKSKGGEDGILSFFELWGYIYQIDGSGTIPTNGAFGRDKSGDFAFICNKCCLGQATLLPTEMVFLKGGNFTMGCTKEQRDCIETELPAHFVTLSDFYIGKYEVTQKLWSDIMGRNPSYFKGCDDCPVEQVSWDDVQVFLKKLNLKFPGNNYRLPTEAEWEYAARQGGKFVLFGNGKNIATPIEINYKGDWAPTDYSKEGIDRKRTMPVGSFPPNSEGLYDMSGNVREWCSDWYGLDYYAVSPGFNPKGPIKGTHRLVRGGSWNSSSQNCKVSYRDYDQPSYRFNYIGLRLARSK